MGQKVVQFYSTTSKQVLDIHEEARRISTRNQEAPGNTTGAGIDVPENAAPVTSMASAVAGEEKAPTVV